MPHNYPSVTTIESAIESDDYERMTYLWNKHFALYGEPNHEKYEWAFANYFKYVDSIDSFLHAILQETPDLKNYMVAVNQDTRYKALNAKRTEWSLVSRLINAIIYHEEHPPFITVHRKIKDAQRAQLLKLNDIETQLKEVA